MGEKHFFDKGFYIIIMEAKLQIKAKIGRKGEEIRRLTIPMPTTFEQFKTSVFNALELSKRPHFSAEDVKLKYEDEESDFVSVYNDADLQEALRQVRISDDNLLRLSITAGRRPEKKEKAAAASGGCPAFGGMPGCNPLTSLFQQLQCSLPDMLANPAIAKMAEGLFSKNPEFVRIETQFVCDVCGERISGDRFHSTTRDNYDVCSACMQSKGAQLSQEHQFEKVTAFQQLLDCLRNGGTFDAAFEETKPAAAPAVHHALCDECSSTIVGLRHKCLECQDFDLCDVCMATSEHEHEFHSIAEQGGAIPDDVRAAYNERKAAAQAAKQAQEDAKKAEEAAKQAQADAKKAAEEASRLKKKEVHVVPKPTAPKPEPKPASAFEANLQTLESMGFTDRKRNIQVLVRNRNKLFESIQELLSQ